MLLLALVIGFACGLRVFTPPAVLLLLTRGGWLGLVFAALAIGEYVADALPQIPPRTQLPSPLLRAASGAYCGYAMAALTGNAPVAGAILGVAGAAIGLYGGLAVRLRMIEAIGAIPAAIAEDVAAIAIAIAAVLH
ncbi:MAG TPA: hypothetical protein VGZ02_10940 [Candidatus Baltobacteraceae bacterium]|jgi:uncharacterized membrane protein|nr:hypothetical protein [Candidatus Baltobacteraceae bacterium]